MIPQLREQAATANNTVDDWPLASRIAIRFGFAYFILFLYPSILGFRSITAFDQNNPLRKLWDAVVPWVGSHILHLDGPFTPALNGSGDQLYDFILWPCLIVAAGVVAAVWVAIDRHRKNDAALVAWLQFLVRLTLAFFMINYGMDKLFRFQFPRLPLSKLVDTYGQSSPQGLLWSFMEYSRGYSFAGGLGEFVGGVLLLIPGCIVPGALLSLAMMSNVLMLDFFYDTPRKILSINLLLMCLFLLAPQVRRLLGFFLGNREEQLTPARPLFREKGLNTAALLFQLALGVAAIAFCAHKSYTLSQQQGAQIEAPLRGIWSVEQFDYDGAPRAPLLSDAERWQFVILDRPELITIQLMDGTLQAFLIQRNQQNASLWGTEDHAKKGAIRLENPQGDQMVISGELGTHRVNAILRRVDLSDSQKFLLINRGFRWVNPTMVLR